ncbi:hypothetical protein Plhal304r1_c011g0042361 [Plasmopara halstedii]
MSKLDKKCWPANQHESDSSLRSLMCSDSSLRSLMCSDSSLDSLIALCSFQKTTEASMIAETA